MNVADLFRDEGETLSGQYKACMLWGDMSHKPIRLLRDGLRAVSKVQIRLQLGKRASSDYKPTNSQAHTAFTALHSSIAHRQSSTLQQPHEVALLDASFRALLSARVSPHYPCRTILSAFKTALLCSIHRLYSCPLGPFCLRHLMR